MSCTVTVMQADTVGDVLLCCPSPVTRSGWILCTVFSDGIRGHKNKPQLGEPCPVFRNETEASL